jgi:hypothetical protein
MDRAGLPLTAAGLAYWLVAFDHREPGRALTGLGRRLGLDPNPGPDPVPRLDLAGSSVRTQLSRYA